MAVQPPRLGAGPHSYIVVTDTSHYPCGSLVELVSKDSYESHTHSVYHQLSSRANLKPEEVASLSREECILLDAIQTPADRYTVYSTPEKLAWGKGLKVGDAVLAQLPSRGGQAGSSGHQDEHAVAIIRWAGLTRIGHRFGVEIMVS